MDNKIAELRIEGRGVVVKGGLCRVAQLDGEGYKFLADPEAGISALRAANTRPDLFTFIEKLPETSPRYRYPREWDNLAALPISTFDQWWSQQICFKARNNVKQPQKKEIAVQEGPIGSVLVSGTGNSTVPQQEGGART